ncbi:MAG: hypothetical protein J4N97_10745 [Chloroflexi bacterium]|nr:hypothetical protein [Chloroflexota bacterium]
MTDSDGDPGLVTGCHARPEPDERVVEPFVKLRAPPKLRAPLKLRAPHRAITSATHRLTTTATPAKYGGVSGVVT